MRIRKPSLETSRRFERLRRVWVVLLVTALAGCAGYSPSQVRPGQAAEDVRRSMGEPTGHYAMPGGGERLEYARGPYGKHTYMIDLDGSGRVTGWTQVLDEKIFNQIKVGMTR